MCDIHNGEFQKLGPFKKHESDNAGKPIKTTTRQELVDSSLRDLGNRIRRDMESWKKYFNERSKMCDYRYKYSNAVNGKMCRLLDDGWHCWPCQTMNCPFVGGVK